MVHSPDRAYRLSNGGAIGAIEVPSASWVGAGIWFRAGSRYEDAHQAGWAHLLEHLWFRGGRQHDAAAVDRLCDRLGGQINAETGRELVGFWGLAPASQGPELLALVTDLISYPRFTDSDVEAERRLVSAEHHGASADPLTATVDGLLGDLWAHHPLARPIAGQAESLATATAASLHEWREDRLVGPRTAGVVIGTESKWLMEQLGDTVNHLPALAEPSSPDINPPEPHQAASAPPPPHGPAGLVWAVPLPGWRDPHYPEAQLALTAIAGGLSAILPTYLRRETGLVYDVRYHIETGLDASAGLIYTHASSPSTVVAAVEERLDAIAADGLPSEAVVTARAQLAAQEALAGTVPVDWMRRTAWELLSGHASSIATRATPTITSAFGPRWRRRAHTV